MIENETLNKILHDYRDDVVDKFQNMDLKKRWHEASNDIIKKTLIYEFEPLCHDVEKYEFVKESAFSDYCQEYDNLYVTSDIMNGWWYCFKTVYKLNESRKAFRNKHYNMLPRMVNSKEEKTLEKYLKVVYTIGNMTPAPYNPGGRGYGEIDFWEYKLERYGKLYQDCNGDIDILMFQDYVPYIAGIKDVKYRKYMETFDLVGYMNDRIDLIIKRGYRILNKRAITEDELKEVKSYI